MIKNDQDLLELTKDLSQKYFKRPFLHNARLNHRLRTTGGRYLPAEKTIELNPKYIIEMDVEEVIGILKHELCHYHLHIQGKGYRHGDEDFKRLLKETGSPRYCKPLPSNKRRKRHTYTCTNCSYKYKRIRRVNVKRYRCGKCHGVIKKIS